VKSLLAVLIAVALIGGVNRAEAGDKGGRRRDVAGYGRYHDGSATHRYFQHHDVIVIRDYYRPYYRPLPPGLRHRYYRTGNLPPGWAKRIHPMPVHVEGELAVVPHGYRRGVIDGHAVVYNDRGFILDVAVLF
jgi:hypothetical protein